MATQVQALPARSTSTYRYRRQLRRITAIASVTLFGLIAISAFLMPLAYMASTAYKTLPQFVDPNWHILPSSPATFTFEGKEYPLVIVPQEDGSEKELALFKKGREESTFLDPTNPEAGEMNWIGRWRLLEPVYVFDPTWDNFPQSWTQIRLGMLFRNTLIIAILSTLGTLLSSVVVAYGFSRFRIPGINTIFMILMATIILPTQVTLIPTYIFFRAIGWSGSWLPLIIPHFFANAYNVFLLRQYFKGIPRDLDEAAMIDGANPIQVLLQVIIPQSWPALTAVSMFHFFWAWNDFFTPLVYLQGREELYTISIGLTQFNNMYNTQPGLAMAAAMITIILPVTIFFMAQKIFMQGIVITGVEK